jgi:ribosomal protein S18 acetylase RimI-like enzyme
VTNPALSFRAVVTTDSAFLCEVYRTTRWDELAVTGWSDEAKRAFLLQQFDCQSRDWGHNYPNMDRRIIRVNDADAGRLYLDRRVADRDLRVVDIALLPAFRGQGVATRIFSDLFTEADERQWRVSVHVEQNNPAKRLYLRLGFAPVNLHGIYLLMARAAPRLAPQPSP